MSRDLGRWLDLSTSLERCPARWLAGAMTDLGPAPWPPDPIRTERLVLREPEARDRTASIELLASPEVHTYLGGPRPRDELEREMPRTPERWPGSFVVDLHGAMIGQILLRRAPEHSRPAAAGKADLNYLFPAPGVGVRVCRRGVRGGTRLVRRSPSR
jgi:RimJ/RimL family protein N-acetyltransferase